ncbi:MAG: DEAD/DEAH box helicase, partial [Candidatus Eremiobacteraeota bacterium]|nr:DEAD/DEAH box helicase [Candidatus Eremiobacteraeota bacterium]
AAVEWCNRRILARIHRLTLARLRREIEPVSAAAMMRFLLRWQRVAPVSLFLRRDAEWLLARSARPDGDETGSLSGPARDVRAAIAENGASFFADIVRMTGRLASEVEDGLWELVAAGLVTADGFDNLRALIDPRRRLALGRHNRARPRNAIGRWALLKPGASARSESPVATHDRFVEAFANVLLARWGIVFRDAVRNETLAPAWRDLLVALRRLELQGEVRGGRFVSSYVGEQFCRPDALDLLRVLRDKAA